MFPTLQQLHSYAHDKQLLPALIFWSGYLVSRYIGPASAPSSNTRSPRLSTVLKAWSGAALVLNLVYFTMHRPAGRGHNSLEASARLLFSMTQLASVPYVLWDYDPSRIGRPLGRYLWDGACIPVLLMLADCAAGVPRPLAPLDIVFYAQSVLWMAALWLFPDSGASTQPE